MSKIKQGMPTWLCLREQARQAMADIKGGRQETQVGPGHKVLSSMEAERRGGDHGAGQVNSITR